MLSSTRAGIMLALSAVPCFAQAAGALLTLPDCLRLAEAAPSQLSIARQQTEIARYGLVQARANFLPQFSLGNNYTYNSPLVHSPNTSSFVALNGIREYSSLATSALDVDTSGRLRAILDRARAERDGAAANLGLARRDLRRAVTASYYRLQLARELVRVTRDSLTEAQAFETRTRLLVQNGEVAQADLIKASAEVAFIEQALQSSELESRLANHDLASFWTTDVDTELALDDSLRQDAPPPEAQQPQPTPFLRRLEFNFLDAERRGFLADARRARADLLPQLSFVMEYGLDANRIAANQRGYAGFAHLNIPVFDWFRARSAKRQFELQAQQVDTNRQITTRAFSREYQDALSRAQILYGQIALTAKQVQLSEDNLRLSRIRYEGGEGSALDVVTAQTQLAQARTNHYEARANYLGARADLEVAAGR